MPTERVTRLVREGRAATPTSRELEPKASFGQDDAEDLRPEHAAGDAPKFADQKQVPSGPE